MSYLIDTNVLSELKKKQPDPNVVHWFSQRPASGLYISVLTVGEIRKGIERSIDGPRKQILLDWLEFELPRFFFDRVVPVNTLVADQWGKLTGRISRPVPAIDSLIAATAHAHNLSLVTRNIRDFEDLGIDVINPFND